MKIDLHLHSKNSSINGDTIKWDSLYDSLKKVMLNDIKAISFTDHNVFSKELYLEAKKLASTVNICVLPGVELNVINKRDKVSHMLVLFDDNLNDNQLDEIEKKINDLTKTGISINNINDFLSEYNSIRIIHVGKNDYFELEDLDNLNYDAFEITNENHHNFKKIIKNNKISSIVSFSDTHSWDKYPQQSFLETNIPDNDELNFHYIKKCFSEKKNYTQKRIKND